MFVNADVSAQYTEFDQIYDEKCCFTVGKGQTQCLNLFKAFKAVYCFKEYAEVSIKNKLYKVFNNIVSTNV